MERMLDRIGVLQTRASWRKEMDEDNFLRQLESCTWPLERWHHRQHLTAAYLYLRRYPFGVAIERMRKSILAYNATHHVPDSVTSG